MIYSTMAISNGALFHRLFHDLRDLSLHGCHSFRILLHALDARGLRHHDLSDFSALVSAEAILSEMSRNHWDSF